MFAEHAGSNELREKAIRVPPHVKREQAVRFARTEADGGLGFQSHPLQREPGVYLAEQRMGREFFIGSGRPRTVFKDPRRGAGEIGSSTDDVLHDIGKGHQQATPGAVIGRRCAWKNESKFAFDRRSAARLERRRRIDYQRQRRWGGMGGENRGPGWATARLQPPLETATLGRRNPWTSRRARAMGTLENSHSRMQHTGSGMCVPEARCHAGGLLRERNVVWIED